jgi:hypothetical protein
LVRITREFEWDAIAGSSPKKSAQWRARHLSPGSIVTFAAVIHRNDLRYHLPGPGRSGECEPLAVTGIPPRQFPTRVRLLGTININFGPRPMTVSTIFIAAIFGTACAILGGLYLIFRNAHPSRGKKTHKRIPLANWK